ncbi:kinetochore scaffold 1 [Heterodontus francisci]|uniref:kinetochore scaffold 1 n=1 Tax=Heterodontus francisci TaxID=7792 RepID=UPI00355B3638
MDENCSVFPEANAEIREGKCKRRQSGILKVSRSPLRTLKEADISQKMEQVGKLRRSSRRVSFAETKEVKEFVTDKMIMQEDVENGKYNCMLEYRCNVQRDMILNTNFSIAGMDALLHAPLRTPLQQFESCEHIDTVSKHQIFPIFGVEVRKEDREETAISSETKVMSRLPKKIDFKSFLTGLNSTEPTYTNLCLDTGDKSANKSFSSVRQNEVPKQQKTIDFKTFLNSIKQSEANENKMVLVSSIFEDQVFKQTGFGVPSACGTSKDIEMTNNLVLQSNSINDLDANRTVMFLDQDDDMEFTRSHTVAINHFAFENTATLHSLTMPNNVERLGNEGSTHSSFLLDKTVVFSGEDYMDMTTCHTAPIDVRKVDHLINQNQLTAVTIQKDYRSILPSFTPNECKIFSDGGYCSKFNQNEALVVSKLTSGSGSVRSSFPSDKTMVFSEANDMERTKSHTVAIDSGNLGQVRNEAMGSDKKTSRRSTAGSILSSFPSDKTMVFSEANDMDITKSHTVAIDSGSLGQVRNEAMGSDKKTSRRSTALSILSSFPSDKTMVFSEANDMDITKSHTVAIDSGSLGQVRNEAMGSDKKTSRRSTAGSILSSFPSDKTMVFSEANDMDITKSHTVAIDSGSLGQVRNEVMGSDKITSRRSTAGSILSSFPSDKTMVFSEANDMDITKSHTVAIDSGSLGQVRNEAMGSDKKTSRRSTAGSILSSFPSDKTMVFSEANDMDITKSHTVAIDSGSLGQVRNEVMGSDKITSRRSTAGSILSSFPSDKTMVFSEANDMDITKSHTVAIDSGSMGQVRNEVMGSDKITSRRSTAGSILSLFPSDKTMVFSEANDMDITKSHTVAIDSGSLGQVRNEAMGSDKKTSRRSTALSILSSFPSDKTMVFSEANDMDITKSHTVAIDSGSLGQVRNEVMGSDKITSRRSTAGSILSSFPSDKTMVFSEANDMDITKSHTVAIDSGSLGQVRNEVMGSDKITSRRSTAGSILSSFPSDKTMVFSEANDMDITKSHTVAIDSGSLGQVRNEVMGSDKITSRRSTAGSILSSLPSDKTMVFSEANDMDITKSHTVAIDSGSLGQVRNEAMGSDKKTSRRSTAGSILSSFPSDKTMVFSEANEMDITKSHTVALDTGSLGQVRNETLSFTRMTSKVNIPRSIQASFPNVKTMVFSETNDMDITKTHTIATESENVRPVANHTTGSDKMTSSRSTAGSVLSFFPSDKTVVFSEANAMDITKSHTVPIDNGKVTNALVSPRMTSKLTDAGCTLLTFPRDKTVVYSEANDMDMTKSHTVVIKSGNLRPVGNHSMDSNKITSRQSTAESILLSFPSDKIIVFSDANDMDIIKSHTVAIDSGNLGQVTNETSSSTRTIPRLTDAGCTLLSLSSDETMVFSEANDMDKTKDHKVAIGSGSLGSVTNVSLGSNKMTSRLNAPGSVLSSFPNDKTLVSEQVMPVTKIDTTPVRSKPDVSSNHKISQLMLEKGQKCFGNHSDDVEFANIQTTVENTICNVSRAVHTLGTSDPYTGSMEITILHTKGGSEQEGEPVSSTCVVGAHEKMNGREIRESVLYTENALDSTLTCKNDKVQEKRPLVDQCREAPSGEFVRYQVNDAQPECTANGVITESVSTANKYLGHNQSRKSSLANMSSLQKFNSATNVTYDTALERPPVGDKDPADCQTWDVKTCFSKQNSLVRDTFKYQISLGMFPPKLPSRESLYKAVNSNHQDVIKTSVEHLGSGSLLSATYKSNKLEEDSNVFKPNVNLQKNRDIQIESQTTDRDQVENKIFDQLELSHCLRSSDLRCLTIPEQLGKEASPASEQDENVTGCQDRVLWGSKMIKSVEQRLYQKRAWSEEEENGNMCSKRKMRNLGPEDTDSSKQKVSSAPVVQWEEVGHKIVEQNLLSMTTKSLDSNSSLDSTKGDGTSADVVTPKCNLNTSLVILEESELHEKLMDGQITVREFFKLLKVQTHAQKSRQSELQVNLELDKSSALENWLAVKFVHRPKREVYEEDSIALSAAITELRDQLLNLDKLLSEVNLPLWKDVMQMTEEELQQFRSCLNAKKTTFVKRTKVICHEQKVKLYSAQLNMLKAQRQQRNEYEDSLDDMLHKMDVCLASLDLANLDHLGECNVDVIHSDESMMQLEQTVGDRHEELKKLQAEHCDVESQLAKVLAEKELQEKAANLRYRNEEFQELLEWTLFLCQDEGTVYTFLYGSLELTLKFGEFECADISPSEKCRRILDINLVSALDEDEAPLHSKLVHELIMTYWKSQGSWHNVYTNESQLPMLLLDVSLVVGRCRLLGDELEYLLNWGSKFDILKTEIQHTDVKYLFSSYDALSKFELTFHLKPGYPWLPLQFTFNSWFGNISGEHINEVLLTVKPGHKYLTRIVKCLFLSLLIIPGANRFRLQHASP